MLNLESFPDRIRPIIPTMQGRIPLHSIKCICSLNRKKLYQHYTAVLHNCTVFAPRMKTILVKEMSEEGRKHQENGRSTKSINAICLVQVTPFVHCRT